MRLFGQTLDDEAEALERAADMARQDGDSAHEKALSSARCSNDGAHAKKPPASMDGR